MSDSSATGMLYMLKYKRREFYDGLVLLLLSITMTKQSQFVFVSSIYDECIYSTLLLFVRIDVLD